MECQIIAGATIAKEFIKDLSEKIERISSKVKLVSFLANNDPSAEEYAKVTKQSCAQSGIVFELRKINRESLEDAIIDANEDDSIHGILVYYPVFGGGHDQYIQNCVNPLKDVEGLCHLFRFNMYRNIRHIYGRKDLKSIIPCTPLAVIKILEYCKVFDDDVPYGNQLHGKIITIINRSEVVGRPLAALLANDGAKVYSVDINDILEFNRGDSLQFDKYKVKDSEKKLEEILSISDIVITGVPSPNYRVPIHLLKNGVIAVNFACAKNFEDDIKTKASIYVPTIGKVTTVMLQRNLLRLYKYRQFKITNNAMTVTTGYLIHTSQNIISVLKNYLEQGFEFILAPLVHPLSFDFIPFTDIFFKASDLSKIAIYIPKRNYNLAKNVALLEKELIYASHIGIYNLILECPNSYQSCEILSIILHRKLISASSSSHVPSIFLKIPITLNCFQSYHQKFNDETMDDDSSWKMWNHIRGIMQTNFHLSLALELNGEFPEEEKLRRWLGEPLSMIILPTSIFVTNSSKYPVLSKALQSFLGQAYFKMARNLSFVVKGNNLHGHLKHYAQYLNHLKDTNILSDNLIQYCRDYEDVLQIPLQPLKDDLDSSVYEVFELDNVKYQQYELAINKALKNISKEEIIVMVVGAGRGPLVERTLKAAYDTKKKVKVFAVEKNSNVVITLQVLKNLKWGGEKGLPHGIVQIVSEDMRSWEAPEKADLVISELLGSFGDNELSPECLDGVWKYVHEQTISIPCSYVSYMCPVQSHRLYSQLMVDQRIGHNSYELGYVVHVRNAYLIDKAKPVFTFEHRDLSEPPSKKNNNRCKNLMFKSKVNSVCHGFVGYFDCCLYEDIHLSIVPETQNSDMYSWFPIYFPIQTPFNLSQDETIEIKMTRNIDTHHVWYEWMVLRPVQSKVHNSNGKNYSISLH